MATVTEKPQPPQPAPAATPTEQLLVDQQISRTRRALKFVDLTAGLITLAIGVLAFLLTMAVLEHWVIPGGWSDSARFLLFTLLLGGCGWYCWQKFWPLIRQPINPVYAAQAIEQSSPSLKNSLLNLLLLRNQKRRMSRQVYQAIESQAAQGLSQVRMDTVVDRSIILRLGYILVALTAVCVLYRVLSPKDLFSSAGRVLLPWSNIATPSRVTIDNVSPGDTRVARGEQLKISAEILGLETDEAVELLYTTADKQIVKQAIPMSGSESGTMFTCKVPAHIGGDRRGVQQDFTYWIEAGDARSPKYSVTVFARPTLVVSRLRYDYPAYTGFPSREVEHTGDIRAVEGTRVTLFAEANKPIKSAHVDFEADGRHDLLMKSTEQQATVTFGLALREDRRTPEHRSYVLKYTTTDGTQNQLPPKYQIDVQPDYAPEIQLLLPEEPMIEVAVNKEIEFELEARDPDFALNQVLLVGQVGEEQKVQEPLLERNHTGKFVGKLRKTPEELGLKPGDVLEYWGAAADNRRPEPNLAYSAHRKIRVVGPWRGNDQGDQNQEGEGQQQEGDGGDPQEGESGQDGQAGGGQAGNSSDGEGQEGAEGQSGEGQSGEPQEGDQAGEGNQQNDGQAGSDGQQNGEQNQQGGANGNSPSDDSQDSDGNNSGEQNNAGQNEGDQGQEGQPGENAEDGQGGQQGKVSSDGSDDGTAFERMADHFNEQEGQSGEGQSREGEPQPNGENGEGQPNQDQSNQGGDPTQDGKQASEGEDGNQAGQEGNPQDQTSEGEGAKGEPAPGEEQEQQDGQGEKQSQNGDSPDGKMSSEQGEGGAGDQKGNEQGAPNSEGTKKPQDKQGDQAEGPNEENGEAGSETADQRESDSEGGESGDRSGGGEQGAGQQADQQGKGAAGQNEAADDGAGQSSEKGEGETGQEAGNQDKADSKTGESSGDQSGNGSEQGNQPGEQSEGESQGEGQEGQPGEQGQQGQAGDQADQGQMGQQPSGQSGDQQQPPEGEPKDQDDPRDENQRDAQPQSGDSAGSSGQSGSQQQSELLPGDKANLDYAKKQTDLILERLEDQLDKKEVDKNLLEKLGWSQDELRQFVDRWKNLKQQADDDPTASDELTDSLRSLGLKRNRTGYNSKISKDKLRDLQEAYRGKVPLEYQDQVNRYLKGTANTPDSE